MNFYSNIRCLIFFCLMLLIQGCRFELQHSLNEPEANEILYLLLESGLDPSKHRDNKQSDKWMICVPSENSQAALQILIDNELPRDRAPGFDELFEKDGLVPSEIQQSARFASALAGELQETLETDDSVLRARVHLHSPIDSKNRFSKTDKPASASVYLKLLESDAHSKHLSDIAIKALVSKSVANLHEDDVIVVKSFVKSAPSKTSGLSRIVSDKSMTSSISQNGIVMSVIVSFALIGLILVGVALRRLNKLKKIDHTETGVVTS